MHAAQLVLLAAPRLVPAAAALALGTHGGPVSAVAVLPDGRIATGGADDRVPPEQGLQYFIALKRQRIPVELHHFAVVHLIRPGG